MPNHSELPQRQDPGVIFDGPDNSRPDFAKNDPSIATSDQAAARAAEIKREFDNVETPEQLSTFMRDHIRYGFVGRETRKVYTPDDPNMHDGFQKEYYLQSPEELLASGHGVCWDGAELERQWFTEHGYKPELYFIMYAETGGRNLPTHTFLVYEDGEKWRWFEHSFGDQRGIHEYDSREGLLADVRAKHHDHAVQYRGATNEDLGSLRLAKYDVPKFGSSPEEFVSHIIRQNPQLAAAC